MRRHKVTKSKLSNQKGGSSFHLDVALILLFLMFGMYLYFYRKTSLRDKKEKTKNQLTQIQNLNYQYFTNNS